MLLHSCCGLGVAVDQGCHLVHQCRDSVLSHLGGLIRSRLKQSQTFIEHHHSVLELPLPEVYFGWNLMQFLMTGIGTHLLFEVVDAKFIFNFSEESVTLHLHIVKLALQIQNLSLSRLHLLNLILGVLLFVSTLLEDSFSTKTDWSWLRHLGHYILNVFINMLLHQL